MATTANLNIIQGATFSARVAVKDSAGSAINLSGYTTRGNSRSTFGSSGILIDLDPDVVSGSSPDYLGTASGLIDINLTAVETAALPVTIGVYDVEMFNNAGTVTRVLQGKMNVSPNVTT